MQKETGREVTPNSKNRIFVLLGRAWDESPLVAGILVLLGSAGVLWQIVKLPPPGVSVCFLALVAGIISVRPKMFFWEKSAWLIYLVAFSFFEFRAIDKAEESNELANAQLKADKSKLLKEIKILKDQNRSGLAIATGGGTTPCMVPEKKTQSESRITLELVTSGPNSLTHVEIKMFRMITHRGVGRGSLILSTSLDYASRNSLKKRTLPLIPSLPPGAKFDHYYIEISTQNGFYEEELWLRPSKSNGWAYSYYTSRREAKPGTETKQERVMEKFSPTGPEMVEACQQLGWSDGSQEYLP